MDQEKFVGKYIELLNATITEAIQKNIVAQAQKTILEEEVSDFSHKISEIKSVLEKENSTLKMEINSLRQQLGSAQGNLHEANVAKQHFETYKNELTSARQEILALKSLISEKDEEIAKYKPAPAPVVVNKLGKKVVPSASKAVKIKNIKDAGSF